MEVDLRVLDITSNILLLIVSGKIRSGETVPLEKQLQKLNQRPPVYLILDVHAVDALDSLGMGILIKSRNEITDRGGRIVLLGVTERVSMIVKISGMDNYFPIATSQAEAVQMLKEPPAPKPEPESSQEPEAPSETES